MRNAIAAILTGCVLVSCGDIAAVRTSPPNILLLVIDTLRADHVGCYGYERNTTPHLDAFARECIVYGNAFANSSWTKPSTASLLTGLNCRGHGVLADFEPLREDVPYLPETLQSRGYHTAGISANHWICEADGWARGFDRWWHYFPGGTHLPHNQRGVEIDDAVAVNQAVRWIQYADGPWFTYVHLMGPHAPYDSPARPFDFGPEHVDQYDAKLRYVDGHVGRLLASVPPGTIVIITSDHGEEFAPWGGLHGHDLTDGLIRVPLLIRWPGRAPEWVDKVTGLDRIAPALLDSRLPETGGEVRCHLEIRGLDGVLTEAMQRTVTADDAIEKAPAADAEALRKEQLEALGYF